MKYIDYKELIVWQKAIKLVEEIYKITKKFPKDELYGLTNQIRRAAVSIPSNIAEGHQRQTDAQFLRFLQIAKGSNAEVETQIIIAQNLKFIEDEEKCIIINLCDEISRMLTALMKKLNM